MPAVSRTSSCASDPQRVSVCVFINVCVSVGCVFKRESEGKCERASANLPHDALPSAMFMCVRSCCVRTALWVCKHLRVSFAYRVQGRKNMK